MIIMVKRRYSQGKRIARIIHLLVTQGSKSFPELQKKFPMFSDATLQRDIKLLKETGLIIHKKESRLVDGIHTRKVLIFFKDDRDIVGKTEKAMEKLKRRYSQVTLELIASYAGLLPENIQEAAYTSAAKLDLPIGKKESFRLRMRGFGQAYGPKAEFTAIPQTALTSKPIKFDASSSQPGWNGTREMPITEYRWNFGDDNKTTTSTPKAHHSFSSSRIYHVALTVYAPGATPETGLTTNKVTVLRLKKGHRHNTA